MSDRNAQEKREPLEFWVKRLVLKAFLWKAVVVPDHRDRVGAESIVQEYIQPKSYRVPKKEVAGFLREFIPARQSHCPKCLLERHPLLPGEQRENPEEDKVRMIQLLTKDCDGCLKEYRSDRDKDRHPISKLECLVTEEKSDDRAYLAALEMTKYLQPALNEEWLKYPQIRLVHYGSASQLWTRGEIKVALRLKELLGWPNEFEPRCERKGWFLPHPMTGRLIPGEIAIIKEMSLRDTASRLSKPHDKDVSKTKPWAPPPYRETRSDQDLYELLSRKPWHQRKHPNPTGNMVDPDTWVTWGKSRYTEPVPGFARRYSYSPVLLRDPTGTTQPEQIPKMVQKVVVDCNRVILQNTQSVRNSNHRPGATWPSTTGDELKNSLKECITDLGKLKPKGCFGLQGHDFGNFFDMHVLPDMCLSAEATHFLRTSLHHCAAHLYTPTQLFNGSSRNQSIGIYCAVCDAYVDEIDCEDYRALDKYLLEQDIAVPGEDSQTEEWLDERREYLKSWDW